MDCRVKCGIVAHAPYETQGPAEAGPQYDGVFAATLLEGPDVRWIFARNSGLLKWPP